MFEKVPDCAGRQQTCSPLSTPLSTPFILLPVVILHAELNAHDLPPILLTRADQEKVQLSGMKH